MRWKTWVGMPLLSVATSPLEVGAVAARLGVVKLGILANSKKEGTRPTLLALLDAMERRGIAVCLDEEAARVAGTTATGAWRRGSA